MEARKSQPVETRSVQAGGRHRQRALRDALADLLNRAYRVRSLSVGDAVIIELPEGTHAFAVDSFGFRPIEVPAGLATSK